MLPLVTIQPNWSETVRKSAEIGLEYDGVKDNMYAVRLKADGETIISVENVESIDAIELIGYGLREHLSTGEPWVVGGVAIILPERTF